MSLGPEFLRLQRLLDFPRTSVRCSNRSTFDRCPEEATYAVRLERNDPESEAPVCGRCLVPVVSELALRDVVLVRRLAR